VFGLITPATPRGSEWNPAVHLNGWEECNVPSLRNLERRLLGVERRLARPVETKIPVTLHRAALDQMGPADRQRLSELKGLTREQIRRRVCDDYETRAFLRRALGLAMRPIVKAVAGDDSQAER
jgi:hypothetical protein